MALRALDRIAGNLFQQSPDMAPGLTRVGGGENVQAQPEAQFAASGRGQFAHALDALVDHRRRFAPHQVGLRMAGCDAFGHRGSAAEADRRQHRFVGDRRGTASAVVPAVVLAAGPGGAEHVEEFGAAGIAFVVFEEVAKGALLEAAGAAD